MMPMQFKVFIVAAVPFMLWGFWLLLSAFSIGGMDTPTHAAFINSIAFIIAGLTGTFLGSGVYNTKVPHLHPDYVYNTKIIITLLLIATPIVLYFAFKGSTFILREGISGFRPSVYDGGGESPVFGTSASFHLYFYLIVPVVYAALFIGASYIGRRIGLLIFWLAVTLLILHAVAVFGRIQAYHIAYTVGILFLVSLISPRPLKKKLSFNKKRFFIFAVILLSIVTWSSFLRVSSDASELFDKYIVNYHTAGFVRLGIELDDPDSIIHDHTFGRGFMGGWDTYIVLVFRQMGAEWLATGSENRAYLAERRRVGDDRDLTFNAYSTSIFALYRDFNYVGPILGGLLLGFFSGFFLKAFTIMGHRKYLAVFLVFSFVVYFGLFMSMVDSSLFWPVLILVAVLTFVDLDRGLRIKSSCQNSVT